MRFGGRRHTDRLVILDVEELIAALKDLPQQPANQCLPALPPGTLLEEKEIAQVGVTEWRLSNGVRVILKPTDFKNDQVLLTAFSPGGSSLVPDSEYIPAATATSIVEEGGLGSFDAITLQKMLAGKIDEKKQLEFASVITTMSPLAAQDVVNGENEAVDGRAGPLAAIKRHQETHRVHQARAFSLVHSAREGHWRRASQSVRADCGRSAGATPSPLFWRE